jgi:hypothetical protein
MKNCIFLFINWFSIGFMSLTAGLCQTVITTKIIRLALASLMLLIIFSETSLAQCAASTSTIASEFTGTGTSCTAPSTNGYSFTSSNMDLPGSNLGAGSCKFPQDGSYGIACDASTTGCFWGWLPTTDRAGVSNGQYVVVNDGGAVGGGESFYTSTLTNVLCASATYTVTFSLANLFLNTDYAAGCGGGAGDPNITISVSGGATITGGTGSSPATKVLGSLAEQTGSTTSWTDFTVTFTTAAGQHSADIIFYDTQGGGCGNDFAFDEFKVVGKLYTPLPVTLIDFNADKEGDLVKLAWSTATEINNDYFLVEKSKNSIDFIAIESLKGAGNSQSILNYETIDHSPYNGVSYYRLKQVDYDGTVSYSKIEAVNFNGDGKITIYPNPGTGFFNIQGLATESEITVDNPLGQTILIKRSFSDSSEIDLSSQPSGVYFIKVNNGNISTSTKIIIHR